jgi:hypothetical protein
MAVSGAGKQCIGRCQYLHKPGECIQSLEVSRINGSALRRSAFALSMSKLCDYVSVLCFCTCLPHFTPCNIGLGRILGHASLSAAQRERLKTCGLRSLMQRRTRQRTATAAFWGGGDDRRPSSKNVLDTTMAWGDILTLLATELVGV